MIILATSYIDNIQSFQASVAASIGKGVMYSVNGGFRSLGVMVIAYLMIKGIIKTLATGGAEPIDPYKHIFIPVFYLAIIIFWPYILSIIESIFTQIENIFKSAIVKGSANSLDAFNAKMDKWQNNFNSRTFTEKAISIVTTGPAGEIAANFTMEIVNVLRAIGTFFEKVSLYFFAGYSLTVKMILQITGIISVVLSMTGHFNSFTTWFKSYMSVYLWVIMGFLVYYVVDVMFMQFVILEVESWGDPTSWGIGFVYRFGFYFIGFGILKLVLLFKVPQFIGMFIGGGSGGGGVFSSALAPLMVGLGAAKMAATAATGGAAGGAAGGNFKTS